MTYTQDELKELYNWNYSGRKDIKEFKKYAANKGIIIQETNESKRPYQYKIIKEEVLYTFEELKKRFNWPLSSSTSMSVPNQIRYAGSHGIEIEKIENKFKIKNDPNNSYTQKELKIKYNWNYPNNKTPQAFINYAKTHNVILNQLTISKSPYYYEIINDELTKIKWYLHPNSLFEVNELGQVRNVKTKRIFNSKNSQGYCHCVINNKSYLNHRLILETLNPVFGMENLTVDHINGIKTDNRLENLRWASQTENTNYMIQNRKALNDIINNLLQQYGYEELCIKLNNLSIEKN